ncbi:MAG: sigma-70 family RNA polymerase sigma factor [Planctomycetes bacterium]|nr:sigma-70 family RNA polymerase sigma factor [Planctomycetota bacterium]
MDAVTIDGLVARAQAGDRRAFDGIVLELMDEVRLYLAARCSSLELVEEVLQRAFITCHRILARYEMRGTFLYWLKGIARLEMLNALSEQMRSRELDGDTLERLVCQGSHEVLEEDSKHSGERVVHLQDCLQRLSPRARQLLARHHSEGIPLKRLAQQFKQTEDAIASVLKRIRRDLRLCIEGRETPA